MGQMTDDELWAIEDGATHYAMPEAWKRLIKELRAYRAVTSELFRSLREIELTSMNYVLCQGDEGNRHKFNCINKMREIAKAAQGKALDALDAGEGEKG